MNIKSNPEWNEKTPQDKRLSVMGIVVAFAVLILAALQMMGILQNAIIIFVPLMALLMMIQAMQMWKTRRVIAVVCIVVAVFLVLCSALFLMRILAVAA